MINILIISIEAKKIKSEEIYFANKKHRGEISFKKDIKLLEKLNLNDVFFFSVNFSFTKRKVNPELERLKKVDPNISECFIMCDRDLESYSDTEIEKRFKNISGIIKENMNIDLDNIHYLKYKNPGQKFEDFLKCHSKDKKLFQGYNKTHKSIYLKTMGYNGKNLTILKNNYHCIDSDRKFDKLFSIRTKVPFD